MDWLSITPTFFLYHMPDFQIKISVDRLQHVNAAEALSLFITSMQSKYTLRTHATPKGNGSYAETILTLPFGDREHIRIDFNLFAAQFEAEHPEEKDVYFKMESA